MSAAAAAKQADHGSITRVTASRSSADIEHGIRMARSAVLHGLVGNVPKKGPRSGIRWCQDECTATVKFLPTQPSSRSRRQVNVRADPSGIPRVPSSATCTPRPVSLVATSRQSGEHPSWRFKENLLQHHVVSRVGEHDLAEAATVVRVGHAVGRDTVFQRFDLRSAVAFFWRKSPFRR